MKPSRAARRGRTRRRHNWKERGAVERKLAAKVAERLERSGPAPRYTIAFHKDAFVLQAIPINATRLVSVFETQPPDWRLEP